MKGIAPGQYSSSGRNTDHIIQALRFVREDPRMLENKTRLWALATEGTVKNLNGQIDVLEGLWEAEMLTL